MFPYQKSPLQRAYENGAHAARLEHARLGMPLDRQVDIFRIIESEGIWLMFQPLGNLFGAYLREAGAAGIIIHAKHPLSLQRFTAAHEYGHHVLGQRPSLDDENKIQRHRPQTNPQEAAAQAFAAHFLMPLELVNRALRNLDLPLKPDRLTTRQAYLLALDLGVSYAAAISHLITLKKIDTEVATALRRSPPKGIKAEIGQGVRPEDLWADVWPLDQRVNGKSLFPRINDELQVALDETPSTGYIWLPTEAGVADLRTEDSASQQSSDAYVALLSEEFDVDVPPGLPSEDRVSPSGQHRFVFRVLRPGRFVLSFEKRRPWQLSEPPRTTFFVDLEIAAKWTGAEDKGLSERQKAYVTLAA